MELDLRELAIFLRHLRTKGAIRVDTRPDGGFALRSYADKPNAPRSPITFDFGTVRGPKSGPLDKYELDQIGKFLWIKIRELKLEFDGIAGVPHSATALSQAHRAQEYHARGRDIPRLRLSKYSLDNREHVGQVLNRHELPERTRVLIIEDTVTKGGRVEEAAEQLRLDKNCYSVTDAIAFLDRQEGAAKNLSAIGVRLHSVATMETLLDPETNVLSTKEIEAVKTYRHNAFSPA